MKLHNRMVGSFRDKIRMAAEVRALIGAFPRKRKVVWCHGVFDLVHPGHIVHLESARSYGERLIVSLTEDRFVRLNKGVGHPRISADLRALNLAALEMVDFVVVDERPHPCELLLTLKPDVYVKGEEYRGSEKLDRLERQVVEGYGGEVRFTPATTVMSSTELWRNCG